MAGIGFALRKLTRQDDLLGLLQAYGHSALSSTGPWMFTVLALGLLEVIGARYASLGELAEFRRIIIYNFAFSLVLSGPVILIVTRYLADGIYSKSVETATGTAIGAMAFMFATQALIVVPFYLHRLGMVGAHTGIDQSNISHADGETALLLPEDPDTSAANLRVALREATGVELGVIIADSMNRPWRLGTIGCAIGCSGITVLDDHVGGADLFGRELKVTLINRVDAIAATATLLMGETTERTPMALVRGFEPEDSPARASDLYRPLDEDLFR